ncbi:MAG: class I SAM-dependent methyltransferase [Minisyncoccota bacterium]
MENCKDRINTFDRYVDLNNICDLGTGEGMFLKVLKDLDYKGMFGIEPSEQVDDFSKKNSLDIHQGTITSLPVISKTRLVNGISMFHLIEHVDDPFWTLNLIYSSLPANGYLIIETPNSDSYVLKRAGFKHELIYPEHLFLFDMDNLKELLIKCGFKIIASGKRDFNPRNLNLRDILFKLGITKHRSQGDKMNVGKSSQSAFGIKKSKRNLMSTIAKPVFSFFVKLLGRQDYFWIIAKK